MDEIRIGYVVKHALSTGIYEAELTRSKHHPDYWLEDGRIEHLKGGKDVFFTKSDASVKAREMAKKKVASLETQLRRMKALAECPVWSRG